MNIQHAPGIGKRKIKYVFTGSPTATAKKVSRKLATGTASDDGSITAYMDNFGQYRAYFSRYMRTLYEGEFTTKKKLAQWLKAHWPCLNGESPKPVV